MAVEGHRGIVRGPDRLPQILGENLRIGPPAGAFIDPAEHIGVGRDIVKDLAMGLAAAARGREEAALVHHRHALRRDVPTRRKAVTRDVSVWIFVIFLEGDGHRHIEQVTYGAAAIDAVSELRHIARNPCLRIDQAALDQHTAQRAGDRLADRANQMRRRQRHAVAVPFADQDTAMQHQQRVGEGLAQCRGHRGRRAVRRGEGHMGQIAQCGGERGRLRGAADFRGRQQFTHMGEAPADRREAAPVRPRDLCWWRRRTAAHDVACSHPGPPDQPPGTPASGAALIEDCLCRLSSVIEIRQSWFRRTDARPRRWRGSCNAMIHEFCRTIMTIAAHEPAFRPARRR